MTRITAVEYLTLDGVMEQPAWSAPYFDDDLQRFQYDDLFEADALLLGRVTYEGFAAAWPSMADDPRGFGARMNALPKLVATRTATRPRWNATFLPGDAVEAVAARKDPDDARVLLVNGSETLLRGLLRRSLVDELRLMVFPVTVGTGARLFGDDPLALRLTSSRTSASGVAILTYAPDGSGGSPPGSSERDANRR